MTPYAAILKLGIVRRFAEQLFFCQKWIPLKLHSWAAFLKRNSSVQFQRKLFFDEKIFFLQTSQLVGNMFNQTSYEVWSEKKFDIFLHFFFLCSLFSSVFILCFVTIVSFFRGTFFFMVTDLLPRLSLFCILLFFRAWHMPTTRF